MTLWMIRHGLTGLGEEGKYQGRLDDGLSQKGIRALERADFRPGRLFVSPALRARETAAILFPDTRAMVLEDLREMDFGAFEGRSWKDMENDPDYRSWVDSGCRERCPGGEDMAMFAERVNAAMDTVLRDKTDGTVIVAHGGTMMAALSRRGRPEREYWNWQLPCGCGWMLDYDPDEDCLRVLREVSFLR